MSFFASIVLVPEIKNIIHTLPLIAELFSIREVTCLKHKCKIFNILQSNVLHFSSLNHLLKVVKMRKGQWCWCIRIGKVKVLSETFKEIDFEGSITHSIDCSCNLVPILKNDKFARNNSLLYCFPVKAISIMIGFQ